MSIKQPTENKITANDKVLDTLTALTNIKKTATIQEIQEASGLSYNQIANACSDLVRKENPRLRRVRKGRYKLIQDA